MMDYEKEIRTCKLLKEYFQIRQRFSYLEREIKHDKARLEELEDEINDCIISVQDLVKKQ